MDLQTRRDLTKTAIEINPTPIVLTRHGKVSDGAGGWCEGELNLPSQTFRIYLSSGATQEIANEGGLIQTKVREMLCAHDADIKQGDTFTLDDRDYKVFLITPVRYLGDIISYQCLLEELS